ncbi:carboxylating nicotinate-nucleotide diphosphorylase [uncultured Bifidobacterium sp.]|uniref:carboxylating nicotinate-nucleotide diphosphorylase n=1 Tax=uncultured Bifidobacterium sp. TaxID=165187 RepID=UPI0028DC7B97|nr:carboxylating nicotinate-nucleotide diphosphorylase [uncultured Bifidobacterium sp.]
MLTHLVIEDAVRRALLEDCPTGDVTSEATIPADITGSVRLRAREDGVLAGIDVFTAAFRTVDPGIRVDAHARDGERFAAGDVLAEVDGPVRGILTAERVALNFTQRMCGIATMTRRFVDAVDAATGSHARITDTRKTVPGLRPFDRHAVVCGGGHNHRYGLSDAVLVKDNHLAAMRAAGLDLAATLRHIRSQIGHTTHIEVEIDGLDQLGMALDGGADTIMFDNFTLQDTRRGVELVDGRALVEASGTMTLDRAPAVAACGVDLISVGALTHSVRAIDLGLDWR